MHVNPDTLEFENLTAEEVRLVLVRNRQAARAIETQWFTAAGVPPGVGDNHWLRNFASQHLLMPNLAKAVLAHIKAHGIPSGNTTPPIQE